MRQDTFRRKTRRRFFRFFGILPLQKKSGSRRADFSARGGKGRKAASLLRRSPVFLRGTDSPSCLCGGGRFSRTGRKRAQSGKPFAGAARYFPWNRFAEPPLRRADLSAWGEKGRKAANLLRAQPGFSPWGFADYGSPSRFCGGGFFSHGAEKGRKAANLLRAQPFFSWNRFAEPPLRRRIFSHGAEKGRTAECRAGFDFIPKRMKRNSGNYSLASSGSKRLCRLRKSRQSGREKIAVSATCGAITV